MNTYLNVANYALTRLSQLGIDLVFGVPGDRAGPNCLNRHYQFISEYLSFY